MAAALVAAIVDRVAFTATRIDGQATRWAWSAASQFRDRRRALPHWWIDAETATMPRVRPMSTAPETDPLVTDAWVIDKFHDQDTRLRGVIQMLRADRAAAEARAAAV